MSGERAAHRRSRRGSAVRAAPEPLATALELESRLRAFARFRRAAEAAGRDPRPADRVLRPWLAAPPWPRLWLVEGGAYGWCGSRLAAGVPLARFAALLRGAPEGLRLPLHTGFGMASAHVLLAGDGEDGVVVAAMEEAAARVAAPGLELAVFESLGFVARTTQPRRLPQLDQAVERRLSPRHALALWHGAGRGLYFVPQSLRPGVAEGVFRRAGDEPPRRSAKEASLAGAGWALMLVNALRPQVVASALARQRRRPAAEVEAILHGAAGAALLWQASGGSTAGLRGLLDAVPGLRAIWEERRRAPLGEGGGLLPGRPAVAAFAPASREVA